jgi:hypothetical protein
MSPPPLSRNRNLTTKVWCLSICFGLCLSVLAFSPAGVWAGASAADLSDTKGEVDPADLKNHSPTPPSLKTEEALPAQPTKNPSVGESPKFPPSNEGVKPGKGGAPARPEPPPYTPKSRFMA